MSAATGADRRRFSVRFRILASILAVAFAGIAGAGIVTLLWQRDQTLLQVDARLLARVESARSIVSQADLVPLDGSAATSGGASAAGSAAAARTIVQHAMPGPHESVLGIVEGRAKWGPAAPVDVQLQNIPGFVERISRETTAGRVVVGTDTASGTALRYVAVPIEGSPGEDPAVYVAAVDLDAELAGVTSWWRTYALVGLGALVAIGLVGWFVAGRLLAPIRRLGDTASRITGSDLGERIPVAGRDDVGELTTIVNSMLDRLQAAMGSRDEALEAQGRLLDDVRHELKTPITIVRGHLELLDAGSPAEVEATRALVLDELDRMALLIEDISSLAESGDAQILVRPADVADLTAEVFAKLSGIPDHEWVLAEVAHATVALDAMRVTQAWLQLADNAAKYSPSGSRVELGSTVAGGFVEFWVADRGPGIPPEMEKRVFERFGRVDSGRGIQGSGLGLAIVTAIAEAHGGRVNLVSSPSGSRFGIVLPLEEAGSMGESEVER